MEQWTEMISLKYTEIKYLFNSKHIHVYTCIYKSTLCYDSLMSIISTELIVLKSS